MDFFDFYRKDRWPHQFCPGCGLGTIMNAMYKAFNDLNMDINKTVFVSGIGCTGRVPGYINADSVHTTHGRALAFATGIKLSRPELNVITISGDGDLFAIGGNHIIHAARRNIDIKVIAVNNATYGLTGGQLAPTTPYSMITTTSPYGNREYPFALADLVAAAGANYVARWTTAHPNQLVNSLKQAFTTRGFSFVEVISQCPVNFGRRNKMGDPVFHLRWIKEHAIPLSKVSFDVKTPYDILDLNTKGLYIIGELVRRNRPVYGETLKEEDNSSIME
ncbi:MAG: thiamine pyrophosphate-dependent enzyme [Thermoplasmata archaeon]